MMYSLALLHIFTTTPQHRLEGSVWNGRLGTARDKSRDVTQENQKPRFIEAAQVVGAGGDKAEFDTNPKRIAKLPTEKTGRALSVTLPPGLPSF